MTARPDIAIDTRDVIEDILSRSERLTRGFLLSRPPDWGLIITAANEDPEAALGFQREIMLYLTEQLSSMDDGAWCGWEIVTCAALMMTSISIALAVHVGGPLE